MLLKTTLECQTKLSFTGATVVKFTDEIEFTLQPNPTEDDNYMFHLQKPKGDFQIAGIYINDLYSNEHDDVLRGTTTKIPYDAETKTFITDSYYANRFYAFTITTEVNFEKVGAFQVTYKLEIEATRMNLLKIFHFIKAEFKLPGYENMVFKCFIKRNRERWVEVTIKNKKNVEIDGSKEDFNITIPDHSDYSKDIVFVFDPIASVSDNHDNEQPPPYLAVTELATTTQKLSLYDCLTDPSYADVILVSSDNIEIPAYRCVLAKHSKIFESIFKNSKNMPIGVNIEESDATTIKAALGYLYGKPGTIKGLESEVFHFATKYLINELKKACQTYLEENVSANNVCAYIQIAYANNFKVLKEKCKEILIEQKAQISLADFKELSKDILLDVYTR